MLLALRRALRIVLASLAIVGLIAPTAIRAEGPKVVSVSVSGNVHVPTEQILAVVKTKPGDAFDEKTVQEDLANIFALGYFADQVPPVIKQRPDGIAITYRVIENPVIQRITFTGNAHVPADTLLALMDTAVGQVFNTNTFHQDVLKINSYYDKIGYGGQVPTHVPDLSIDPATGVLTLSIQEGLTVRNVIITPPPQGDPVLPPPTILQAISLRPGQPYSEQARDKDFDALKALYEKYDLNIGDVEAGIDPSTVDTKKGTADVRYTIQVARVGAIQITGNTKTHDDVIRRELRLRPGMLVTNTALKRDYERLNSTGFFEKIDFAPKPGPDPKKPANITIAWNVKEQRTGTAQVGAGYTGGLTGQGLTGTLSYSENNINGTGNGASVKLERGSRASTVQLSVSVPYVGKTERSQKYSLGATVFATSQTNFYPVYQVPNATPVPGSTATPGPQVFGAPIPVTLIPLDPTNPQLVGGVVAQYGATSSGISVSAGRRFTDYVRGSLGLNVQQVSSNVTLPVGYVFNNGASTTPFVGPTANPNVTYLTNGSTSGSQALGITAPSIANIDSTKPYALRSLVFGLTADTRDDIFNPRRGINASISDEVSGRFVASDFNYSIITLDAAKFYPVLRNATFGLHGKVGTTTGAIPSNRLFTLTDQDLRGYSNVYYGTNLALFQAELRVPITQDRKFAVAAFVDEGGTSIRGAQPIVSGTTVIANPAQFLYRGDVGVGLRFDVPQLGLRTIRLDFARGNAGTHTAFGIGQSF